MIFQILVKIDGFSKLPMPHFHIYHIWYGLTKVLWYCETETSIEYHKSVARLFVILEGLATSKKTTTLDAGIISKQLVFSVNCSYLLKACFLPMGLLFSEMLILFIFRLFLNNALIEADFMDFKWSVLPFSMSSLEAMMICCGCSWLASLEATCFLSK